MIRGPHKSRGYWYWKAGDETVEIRFVGRGPRRPREQALRAVAPQPGPLAWLQQVHSAEVTTARTGDCGRADALISDRPGLVLSVATADCVPIVVAANGHLAAIHAGWRGIAGGLIFETIQRMEDKSNPISAWLGPAIGVCCYEVGEEVADRVAAASTRQVIAQGAKGRPHLDLLSAAASQLRTAGVGEIQIFPECTKCHHDQFWSHRREGKPAGRNWTFAWLRD